MGSLTGSLSITYHGGGGAIPWKVKVVDACTGDPVPGAKVYFQGNVLTASNQGEADLGTLDGGGTFGIKATAPDKVDKEGTFQT